MHCRAVGGLKAACLAQDTHPLPARDMRSMIPRGGIDEETLEVRAVKDTESNFGDAPIPPDLFDQVPAGEEIGSVTTDGA